MTEVHIGRLVAASLHQAIGEQLPQRLEFYETWLHSEALREGSIGLAPMVAVLGFLRTEGEGYDRVVARAGELSAEWVLMSHSSAGPRLAGWLPRAFRVRSALRVAGRIVETADSRSRLVVRATGRFARVEVVSSVFCAVRDRQAFPLCGFYRSVVTRTLAHFGLSSSPTVHECRGTGHAACAIEFAIDAGRQQADTAVAA